MFSETHFQIFDEMKTLFSDIDYFQTLIAEPLQRAIVDCDDLDLSVKLVKKFTERYFVASSFASSDAKKEVWKQIKRIFKALCVLIVSKQDRALSNFWNNTDDLKQAYPEFASAASAELDALLKYRNMVTAALVVIEARLSKQLIIDICGRLEGSQTKYITGRGQSRAVTQRVKIYQQEGKITPEARPYRRVVRVVPANLGSPSPVIGKKRKSTATTAPKVAPKSKKRPKMRTEVKSEGFDPGFEQSADDSPVGGIVTGVMRLDLQTSLSEPTPPLHGSNGGVTEQQTPLGPCSPGSSCSFERMEEEMEGVEETETTGNDQFGSAVEWDFSPADSDIGLGFVFYSDSSHQSWMSAH